MAMRAGARTQQRPEVSPDVSPDVSLAGWLTRIWARLRAGATSTAGQLFAFFSCLYVLTYLGRTNSYDGHSMYLTTQALVDRGSLAIANPVFGVVGRGGAYYSYYGIGMSLAETPFYLVGKLVGLLAPSRGAQVAEAVTMLLNPLLSALLVVVAYLTLRALAYPRATALRATLVLGIATSLWPYSKTDFSEPLLALCVAAAVLFAILLDQRTSRGGMKSITYPLLIGAALGAAVLTKYIAIAFVPLFCVYLTFSLPRPLRLSSWLRRQALLLAPVLAAGLIVLLVNDLRFGSPLDTGYPPGGQLFTIPVVDGIEGLLFSAKRGLFFYDPLLFAGLVALPLWLWRRWREAFLPCGLLIVSLVLYGGFVDWGAGDCWGPRYLLPVLPFLLWPLLALGAFGSVGARGALLSPWSAWHATLSPRLAARLRRAAWAGTALLVAASIAVQLVGVTVNFLLLAVYAFDPGSTHAASASPANDIATAPLVVAVWLLPLAIQFALTKTLPSTGFTSHDYPFGPPFPHNPQLPAAVGQYYPQWFWFTLTPRPLVALLVGGAVLGLGIVLAGRALWPALRSQAG